MTGAEALIEAISFELEKGKITVRSLQAIHSDEEIAAEKSV